MRRALAQWLVSRSLDAGREPPHWLRGWFVDEEELASFATAAKELATSLNNGAPSWRAVDPAAGRQQGRASKNGLSRWSTAGILAGSLALIGAIWLTFGNRSKPEAPATSPANAALFVAAIEEGWLAAEELLPLSEPIDSWPWLESAHQSSPAAALSEATSIATRRTFATFDAQVRQQHDALGSQMSATLTFFAYRLPTSAAKMVGLQPTQVEETLN